MATQTILTEKEITRHIMRPRQKNAAEGIDGRVEEGKRDIDKYVKEKEASLKGETGNVYFAAFNVTKKGRLIMYSDPSVDKIRFDRERSRLKYKLAL